MEDKLLVKIIIADRSYPLRVSRDEEEKIRKAAKVINDKVLQYKERYPSKNSQDCLAMCALHIVIQKLDVDVRNDILPLMEEVEEMNDLLAGYLEE